MLQASDTNHPPALLPSNLKWPWKVPDFKGPPDLQRAVCSIAMQRSILHGSKRACFLWPIDCQIKGSITKWLSHFARCVPRPSKARVTSAICGTALWTKIWATAMGVCHRWWVESGLYITSPGTCMCIYISIYIHNIYIYILSIRFGFIVRKVGSFSFILRMILHDHFPSAAF